ncbi:MAG: hypothetical protein NXH86_15935 [Flavobacteriaceae bacterium]|uniref:hypothetical protein n=1 Tax=Flagellimonas sp. SN16 TaxID=3415142 RepID=UPI000E252304|nr:hypothetical protein [Flavobacteriaceae bacterium]
MKTCYAKKVRTFFFALFALMASFASAQGNIHAPGEGGVFTQNRLALMKTYAEEADIGNNPWMMDLYNDMRTKMGRLGEDVNLTLEDIDGTIYLDESFQLGGLYQNGVAFKRMYMRFDAYNDEVELRESPDSEVTRSMVKNEEYSCSINGDEFLYMQYTDDKGATAKGYLSPLVKGGGEYVLYEKRIKVFKEGKPAKTSLDKGFPHRFLDKVEYYVSVNGGVPVYMRAKKSEVLEVFSDEDQKKVKQFIKDRHINLGDNMGLMNLFAYANTL